MPIDAICLAGIRSELERRLVGMRVDKIQQPERDTLLLSLHGNGAAARLLLCAGTGNARAHVTGAAFENPASPPMFCMLLRKHLTGARLTAVTQPERERVLDLELEGADAMGEPCTRHLIAEMMGRNANLVLTEESGHILDCLRRVDHTMSETHPVLPGLVYRLPPAQDKETVFEVDPADLPARLHGANPEQSLDHWLLDTLAGISPLWCRELAFRAYGDTEVPARTALQRDGGAALERETAALQDLVSRGDFTPCLLLENGEPRDFSFTEIRQYEGFRTCVQTADFSELLDRFYTERDRLARMRQRSQELTRTVRSARDRTARKLELQRQELAATADRETLRENGDIIKANLHAMERGMRVLRAYDFYDPDGGEREIRLDPAKTPQQNAAKYYKDYTKAKNAEKFLTEQIASGSRELDYLNSVLEALGRAEGERDLAEIRQELAETGYLKRQPGGNGKREKRTVRQPMRFRSSAGLEILVGRNNAENDRLTRELAGRQDVWLHTQKIHGSHVVLVCGGETPDEASLREAAMLAAWFSQGRSSGSVPVDYTRVRYVKKPAGARPGMVLYMDYKTLYVTPDPALAEALKAE